VACAALRKLRRIGEIETVTQPIAQREDDEIVILPGPPIAAPPLAFAAMIHVATIHWQSSRWVDVQLRHLQRWIEQPYRVYAWLKDLPSDCADRYHYSRTDPISDHATKLNLLADVILERAESPEDILIFLDGDAFPIAPLAPFLRETLGAVEIAAIRRDENAGEPQPRPAFCASRVAFWRRMRGDWRSGPHFADSEGRSRTDVGTRLWRNLSEHAIAWHALRRSNRIDLHPLWFGVYDDLIYHHGAGFRSGRSSRIDDSTTLARVRDYAMGGLLLDALARWASPSWQRAVIRAATAATSRRRVDDRERVFTEILEHLDFAERLGFVPGRSRKSEVAA
jgi:hypothetical protein